MPHLPPAHHETSKHDSPNETKIKEEQNETIPDSNSNLAKSMTHHNQIKELTTWFLNGHGDHCGTDLLLGGGGGYQVGMVRSPASGMRWATTCNVKSVSTHRCH
jgi:hypothetical protein